MNAIDTMNATPVTAAPQASAASPAANIVPDDAQRQRCEIWTRVMGYHRPVSSFNTGKKGEFHERVAFREQPQGRR